jgi:hypothetical protein
VRHLLGGGISMQVMAEPVEGHCESVEAWPGCGQLGLRVWIVIDALRLARFIVSWDSQIVAVIRPWTR